MLRGRINPKQTAESMSCDDCIAFIGVHLCSEVYYEFLICQMHPYVMHLVIDSVPLYNNTLFKRKEKLCQHRCYNLPTCIYSRVRHSWITYFWRNTSNQFGVFCQLNKPHCIYTTRQLWFHQAWLRKKILLSKYDIIFNIVQDSCSSEFSFYQ